MNDLGSGLIGSFAANLNNDSHQNAFHRANHEECESLSRTNSSDKEDDKSVKEQEQFELYEDNPAHSHQFKTLTVVEKKFLLAVERGDLPAVKRYRYPSLGDSQYCTVFQIMLCPKHCDN